jgi:hypothetical protein
MIQVVQIIGTGLATTGLIEKINSKNSFNHFSRLYTMASKGGGSSTGGDGRYFRKVYKSMNYVSSMLYKLEGQEDFNVNNETFFPVYSPFFPKDIQFNPADMLSLALLSK